MKIIVEKNPETLAQKAYGVYQDLLTKKPKAVLGLATGTTPMRLYELLIEGYQQGALSFKQVVTFNLDEYLDLDLSHPQSYHSFMDRVFFNHVDIDKANTHIPHIINEEYFNSCLKYEALLMDHPIDLQLLGLGSNGHIGFNEPGTNFRTKTHIVELAESTREDNARLFEEDEEVPSDAITMGISSIMSAQSILVLAYGERKAEAVYQMIKGEINEQWPCTILQTHPDVTLIVDEEAYAKVASEA